MDTQPATQSTPQCSLWANLGNVIAAPGDAFDAIRSTPPKAAHWLVPALLLAIIGSILGLIVISQPAIWQQISEVREQAVQKMVASGQIKAEDAAKSAEARDKIGAIFTRIAIVVAGVLDGFARPFIAAALLWLLATKVLKFPLPYLKAVEAAGLASIITLLNRVITSLLTLVMGNVFVNPGPILFIKTIDFTQPLHLLLATLNLLNLWYIAVLGIALARLTGVTVGRASGWCFAAWGLTELLKNLPALLMH